MSTVPVIYNLFPRLVGHMRNWIEHTARAREMGFNWVFINPFHYPGFSGSLYAVKDFYRLNPLFVPPGVEDPMGELRSTVKAMHQQGLQVMMDLVVNHTSKDSSLIESHPTWFRRDRDGAVVSPSAIDPSDASKVTVWGDLAEVDNAASPDQAALWSYWTALVEYYLDVGFDGFRCDAAYKIPAPLWNKLIDAARQRRSDAVFAAETLGCRVDEVRALADCGFDYLFNSSKWWNFDAPWCIEQHTEFGAIAPSIAFPESHDTERLMAETGGLVEVQKQRYAFAATFSTGLMMPVGYEYCFTKPLHVVKTLPEHWEETGQDLSRFITDVNRLKLNTPTLRCEGRWEVVSDLRSATTVLCKRGGTEDQPVITAINKDWKKHQSVKLRKLSKYFTRPPKMVRVCTSGLQDMAVPAGQISLEPAEVVLILA